MKQLKNYMVFGALFVMIVGTLSHFVYEWSDKNPIIGLITPVNESTWEHMKLIFFPMLLASFGINGRLKQSFPCVTSSLAFGIILGTFLIPVIFYTYAGILGYHLLVLDIITFLVSVAVAFYTAYKLAQSCNVEAYTGILLMLVFIIAICFVIFTYHPPSLGLFSIPGK